jgi:hypothetical protein
MPDTGFDHLVIVALAALLAPLTVAAVPVLRVPAVVVEVVVGVASVLVSPAAALALLREPAARSVPPARPPTRHVPA